jgi:hypothetical protein
MNTITIPVSAALHPDADAIAHVVTIMTQAWLVAMPTETSVWACR